MADNQANNTFLDAIRAEFAAMPAGARVPTIRDVSKRFSVSQFSVQRAFETLKEEGLIRSFVGRGSFIAGEEEEGTDRQQASSKDARILIVCHATPSWRGARISESLHAKLLESGYQPISVSYSAISDLSDLLGRGGFDVCVLQPRRSTLPVEILAMLKSKAKHLIIEGRHLELMDVDVVVRNRAKSMALAFNHLRSLGHSHIGLVTEQVVMGAGYAEIENLYLQNLASLPDQPEPLAIRVEAQNKSEATIKNLQKAIKEELEGKEIRPSAFIVSGRFRSQEIEKGFQAANLSIPKDISVVHLRSDNRDAEGSHQLTSVGRSTDQVVNSIKDLISWRIAHPGEPAGLVLDAPILIKRLSTQQFSKT